MEKSATSALSVTKNTASVSSIPSKTACEKSASLTEMQKTARQSHSRWGGSVFITPTSQCRHPHPSTAPNSHSPRGSSHTGGRGGVHASMEYTFNLPTSWATSQGPHPSLASFDQAQPSPLGANNLLPWAVVPVTGCSNDVATCVKIYNAVRQSQIPNYLGVKLPLPSGLLIPEWRRRLVGYHDELLCDYLAYGWPINYMAYHAPVATHINHSSALAYPRHVDQFLARECKEGAMLGPFPQPPFSPWSHTSPLLTRE